jgi:flagellar hook-length control protein FliK
MSNIIHSSSLLNVADGKNEIPVDLSRPKETQQGIDFKDIYSGLANEASRMSPPVDQKPGDGFQKDLATIADARNSDSGELRQQISEVQQPFGKILPTLVAHQRGLSLGKVILTAPVSAVSENSLKQFIMRQSAVDEVIDRGRTTDTEKDESALRGVRSEEMVSALPNKNPRAEIDYGVYSQHIVQKEIVQKQIVQKQIAPKQTANAQAFAASTVSRAPTSNEMGLNQQQYPSAEMLTARSPSAIGKTESSLGEQIQRPAQAGADLAGVDKDYLGAKQRASTLKAGPVSELSLVLGQTSALDKPVPNAAQAAVLDKAPPVLGQTAVLDKPVPVLGQTASWLSQFNTMPREIPSGASMPSAPEGSSVVSRELNSSREEVGLKSEQLLSKDSYSERKANGPQFMASNGESTKPGLISSGAEKPLEEQQMLKSSRLSAEILSSDAREKGFRGKEYSDGVNPKQDMVVEALARNLRMMSPSARQDLNSAGYQGQKPALPGTYGISKRPNGSALEVSDKVNVQNIESRVEFRSVLREMQLQPQLQSTSDKSLQYEGLTQRFGELVANRIIAGVQQDNWNLNIKLRPASLGEIGVTIAYDEGGLEGKIVAAEETTRQLLQDSLPKLRLMLKEMLENDQMVNVNVDSHSDLKQDTKEKPDDENDATVELVMDLLDEATEKVEGRGLGIGNLNIYV